MFQCPSLRKSDIDANHQAQQAAKPPAQAPTGISKSRTVDAFQTRPTARQVPPGRSPSSLSLLESRSRQEAQEEPRSTMFSSGFLSGANPLSAVSSAVNKFSLFGDDESSEAKKQKDAKQKQAAKPADQAPQPAADSKHQGSPKKGQQQGPKPGGPSTGPAKAGASASEPPSDKVCKLCKTTQLNLNTKEAPNYKTCTQCKSVVCSLCGFSPPDSKVRGSLVTPAWWYVGLCCGSRALACFS